MRAAYVRKVHEVAYHRNGIGGDPFHIVRFTHDVGFDADTETLEMIAVVFEEKGSVAVLDLAKLADDRIAFADNSWRGDRFERELRAAIKEWEAQQ